MTSPAPATVPALPPELARLYATARADAIRQGHATVNEAHLVLALAMARPDLVGSALGRDVVAEATLGLPALPRTFTDPIPSAGCVRALTEAAASSDPLAGLASALRSSAGVSRPGPAPVVSRQAPGPGGLVLSAIRTQYAEVVVPPPWLLPRPEVADALIAALAAERSPLLVGAEGSGRTTSAAVLAAALRAPAYTGPLRGVPVVLVRTADVVAVETGPVVHDLLVEVAGRAVVVIDDLEVLSGIAGGSRLDAGLLAVVRGAVHGSQHRVALMLADRYDKALAAQEPELVEECVRLQPAAMPAGLVAAVATRRAGELAGSLQVVVDEPAIGAAVTAPGATDTQVQPGLAVRRLEHAAALAALRPDRTVRAEDVVTPVLRTGFDPVAFRAALAAAIVGQDPALDEVTRRLSVTLPEMDLRPLRPDGVFLFAGPTGTGKTALAEAMAATRHSGPDAAARTDALVRLDMSEYSEPHTVAKLVGSPPGYVGSTDPSSWLTTKIMARPDCVLLLDEIEKADPAVWNTFLQVFDAGRLSDGLGRTADFARVVVVMTTNLGASVFEGRTQDSVSDRDADVAAVLAAVKERMAPELINRLDAVLVFEPLTPAAVRLIARRLVDDVVARMAQRGYQLTYDETILDPIVAAGYDPAYGARPLQRALERLLVVPLAACAPGRWHASVAAEAITWTSG